MRLMNKYLIRIYSFVKVTSRTVYQKFIAKRFGCRMKRIKLATDWSTSVTSHLKIDENSVNNSYFQISNKLYLFQRYIKNKWTKFITSYYHSYENKTSFCYNKCQVLNSAFKKILNQSVQLSAFVTYWHRFYNVLPIYFLYDCFRDRIFPPFSKK